MIRVDIIGALHAVGEMPTTLEKLYALNLGMVWLDACQGIEGYKAGSDVQQAWWALFGARCMIHGGMV